MTDQPDLRASHADRDRVVETLRIAAGDGRLSAEELDARLESALTARTLGQLAELTSDLPADAGPDLGTLPVAGAPPAKDVLVIDQVGGQFTRLGGWTVPGRIEVRSKMCDILLDFSAAVISHDVLRIDCDMRLGKLIIVGGPNAEIDTDGLTLAFSQVRLRGDRNRHDVGRGAARPLRIEITGTLKYGKVIERRARRRRSAR
ncbi:DUF1707 SHOCT-like domain-containing protein [Catenulispora pinisilvae]|uniref:DUF1707 SHOCT-like domain-containing protein n=1 Tax=Catenulispora pinisilvae TaxID=2705253 RepID=UPI001890C0F4|nr:DUF1707 domain-containing protein [Catenulispora pinisilvae]